MENPGSFRESLDRYSDLPRDEVMKIWSGELCKWREFVKLPVHEQIGQLVLFEEVSSGETSGHSSE